jgi:hypothetical protein
MANKIFQVQVVLNNSKPKIWRRLLVPSDLFLSDFHYVIQTAMGWTNSHLHQFIKDRTFYAKKMAGDDLWDEMDNVDYKGIRISDMLKKEKDKILYEYDFGDGWVHTVILEKILPADKNTDYPVCIAGKMSCPPEDCGGVWGFAEMMEIVKDRAHEEYESCLEWLGEDFDPKRFDMDQVNKMLKRMDF